MEQRYGYIHDMADVKVLILFVLSRTEVPVSAQTIYELCYQDDLLSYFDVQQAIPEMVRTGHLEETVEDRYVITEKGKEAAELTQDAVAFTVRQRAQLAVDRYHSKIRRDRLLRTEIRKQDAGDFVVVMALDDPHGCIMNLELAAPTLRQARKLEAAYRKNAEIVYQSVMIGLLEDEAETDEEIL
jgi:hypothetical protein